ncbi:MAG: hypothetical protein R2795_24260 [Saprospiraceae bacterium]
MFAFELSAQNLYPYRWTVFAQAMHPISPLINAGVATLYSPVRSHALFLNPTFSLSIANNWSWDVIGQVALDRSGGKLSSPLQVVFTRVKFSY